MDIDIELVHCSHIPNNPFPTKLICSIELATFGNIGTQSYRYFEI